jgi:hypothetical protein
MLQKLQQGPTLATIRMVEKTLQNMPNSVMTIPELKRALPKQVNHNTLIEILEYLEQSYKIAIGLKGITWIYNTNTRLAEAIRNGHRL